LRAVAEAEPDDASHWRRLSRALAEVGDAEGEAAALERLRALEA